MSSNRYPFLCTARGSGHQQFVHKTIGGNDKQGRIQGEDAGGAHPPPPPDDLRPLSNQHCAVA